MAFKSRVWGAGKVLLLAAALVATYGLFVIATMRVAFRARDVQMPDVSGLEVAAATRLVGDDGLTVRVDDNRRFDAKIAAGRIVGQDPAAGATIRRGRSVRVWISRGPKVAVAPNLVGETERTALVRLTQEGMQQLEAATIQSNQYPADIIVAQDPPAGLQATNIALLVNHAELASGYVMPDLIGVPAGAAMDTLRGRGLRAAIVAQQVYPGVPAGFVLRQNPAAGFQVKPDVPISIEVSR